LTFNFLFFIIVSKGKPLTHLDYLLPARGTTVGSPSVFKGSDKLHREEQYHQKFLKKPQTPIEVHSITSFLWRLERDSPYLDYLKRPKVSLEGIYKFKI
jgi:hypothetical protein